MTIQTKEVVAGTRFAYNVSHSDEIYEIFLELYSPIVDIKDFTKKYNTFIESYLRKQESVLYKSTDQILTQCSE